MMMTMICRSLTSSRSVERICGKDGRWGPGLPKCRGDYHLDSFKNICGVDGDDGACDNINDDEDDDMTLTTGHGMPCIWATLSQGTPCLPTSAEGHSI